MADQVIEVGDAVPSSYEAIAFRKPRRGETFITDTGVLYDACDDGHYPPRLIVRKKEVATKARPYNAEEMRNLYIGRARLVRGDQLLDVTRFDQSDSTVYTNMWSTAEILQQFYTHLDGSKCEVVE